MSTGVIILNYNSSNYTIQCIQSIEKNNSAPIKYIIVDNGSSIEEEVHRIDTFLKSSFPNDYFLIDSVVPPSTLLKASFLVSKSNDGYAEGNNKGLRLAFQDQSIKDILILNNDVYFNSDIIPVLLSYRERLNTPGILTPLLYNLNGRIELNCARRFPSNWEVMLPYILFRHNLFHILSKSSDSQKILLTTPKLLNSRVFPIDMPSGSFMFINKTVLMEMNGLDNGTFLYYEENILCKKLSTLGLCNYCVPLVTALHIGGASTGIINNLFLQKCNLESANYYLMHYAKLSSIQHLVWFLIKHLWVLKFRFKELHR